jgi:hypothetical protein
MLLVKKNFKFHAPVQKYHFGKLINCQNGTFEPVYRGVFFQFPFQWIHYYGSNEYIGKETGKMHLCAVHEN